MSQITQRQAHDYFQKLVELQPETAVDMLFVLFSREVDVEEWIGTTTDNMIQKVRITY